MAEEANQTFLSMKKQHTKLDVLHKDAKKKLDKLEKTIKTVGFAVPTPS